MFSRLFAMFAGLFMLAYAASASGASIACASDIPMVSMAPGHCAGGMKKHDCAIACASLCVAIAPAQAGLAAPPLQASRLQPLPSPAFIATKTEPDPPPPRG